MGMYWQPCTDSAECKTDDVNLECVVREDQEGFWYVQNITTSLYKHYCMDYYRISVQIITVLLYRLLQ